MYREIKYYVLNNDKDKLFYKFNSKGEPLYIQKDYIDKALRFTDKEGTKRYIDIYLSKFGSHSVYSLNVELPLTDLEKIYFNDDLNSIEKVYQMAEHLHNNGNINTTLYSAIKKMYSEFLHDARLKYPEKYTEKKI